MDKNQNANYKTPHNTQTYKKGIKRKCIKQKVDMRNLLCSKHMSTKRIDRKKSFQRSRNMASIKFISALRAFATRTTQSRFLRLFSLHTSLPLYKLEKKRKTPVMPRVSDNP